jgi:hypothetical protein
VPWPLWVTGFIVLVIAIAHIAYGPDALGLWNWPLLVVAFILAGWAFTMQAGRGTSTQHRSRPPLRGRAIMLYGIMVLGILLYALLFR